MESDRPDVNKLFEWWERTSMHDCANYIKKEQEYGSIDLMAIGQMIEDMIPHPTAGDPRELGILFYLLGKIARAISAVAAGRIPSDDTWHDITVYSMMVRKFRYEAQMDQEQMMGFYPDADLADVE